MDQSIAYEFYYRLPDGTPVFEYFISGVQFLFINHSSKSTSAIDSNLPTVKGKDASVSFHPSFKEIQK